MWIAYYITHNPLSPPTHAHRCCVSPTCGNQASKYTCTTAGTVPNTNLACDPATTCTSSYCCASTCVVYGPGAACDDGNTLTTNDKCNSQSQCVGTLVSSTCGAQVTQSQCASWQVVNTTASCTIGGTCTPTLCCIPQCSSANIGSVCNDNNVVCRSLCFCKQ